MKKVIKKYAVYFSYFYGHVRYRMFLILCTTVLIGVLDGFGLTMFLPLLEMVDGQQAVSSEKMGNMSFIVDFLEEIGIPLTLQTVLLVILGFFVLKGIARFIGGYYKVLVSHFFVRKLRRENIDLLSDYSYKSFITADSGRIQNTLSAELSNVSGAFANYLTLLQSGVMLTVYLTLAFLANPQFALLITIGGLISNLLFRVVYKKNHRDFKAGYWNTARISGIAHSNGSPV